MTSIKRHFSLGCLALCLSACAHQPAAPPKREPVVLPESPAAAAPIAADTSSSAAPSIMMPREWQHHNGELFREKLPQGPLSPFHPRADHR